MLRIYVELQVSFDHANFHFIYLKNKLPECESDLRTKGLHHYLQHHHHHHYHYLCKWQNEIYGERKHLEVTCTACEVFQCHV